MLPQKDQPPRVRQMEEVKGDQVPQIWSDKQRPALQTKDQEATQNGGELHKEYLDMWVGWKTNAGVIFRQLEILSQIPHLKQSRFLLANHNYIKGIERAL